MEDEPKPTETPEAQPQPRPESPAPEPEPEIDPGAVKEFEIRIKSEQNIFLGVIGGAIGAVLGAVAWGLFVWITNIFFGLIAVLVGVLVGLGVRKLGRGVDTIFGVIGGVFSVFGLVLGNILVIVIAISSETGADFFTVLTALPVEAMIEGLKARFHPLDLLFYGIALYEGYKLSFRRITPEEAAALLKPPAPGQ